MTVSALISLRETFEASLIVCVMLAFLERTKRMNYAPAMWLGVGAGIVFSMILAAVMQLYAASLVEEALELYEGIMMISAAFLLLWMIGWMALQGRNLKSHIEKTMELHIAGGSILGIFLLSFTSTAREGAEMVLLIHATLLSSSESVHAIAGTGIGIVAALALAVLLLKGIRLIPLHHFFTATGIFLLMLGAGLTMHGVGELQEAGVFSLFTTQAWDTAWLLPKGSLLGEIAEILIGYEPTPSVLQVLGGALYATLATATWKWTKRTTA